MMKCQCCLACSELIELAAGCNHMTCKCSAGAPRQSLLPKLRWSVVNVRAFDS